MMKCIWHNGKGDIKKAVDSLIEFKTNWCINCDESVDGNLVFKCNECVFSFNNDYCKINQFINQYRNETEECEQDEDSM